MAKKTDKDASATKKPLKVKVVGTGGIGLSLLPNLCRYLNYSGDKFPSVEVSMIDGDHFEERNRERQEFVETGPKASMTAAEYRGKFPRLLFWDHPVYVDEHNIIQLIRENDIVMLCVDNHKTRKLISDRAEELKNVTVISGGNDYTDGNVLVHIRRDGVNLTPPLANKYHPEIMNPNDKHPGEVEEQVGCAVEAQVAPQLLFANDTASLIMKLVFRHIVEPENYAKLLKAPENFAEFYFDLETMAVKSRPRKV